MKQDEGGCAIVCAEDQSVAGIFTERDLLNKIVGQGVDPECSGERLDVARSCNIGARSNDW